MKNVILAAIFAFAGVAFAQGNEAPPADQKPAAEAPAKTEKAPKAEKMAKKGKKKKSEKKEAN